MNYRGLQIAFRSFGNVNSDDLFGPGEQPIFDFYLRSKARYRKVADIGANIGVHSLLMAQNGWSVRAYEPDPEHMAQFEMNLVVNETYPGVIRRFECAVSDTAGRSLFVRVKGNTTGSHLKGDKEPYGELEEFLVEVVDCRDIFEWADFCKIDAEGCEARLLRTQADPPRCEFMVEVGSEANAEAIYAHFRAAPMWSQRTGWKRVEALEQMPAHHSHGALFIGKEPPFGP